MSYSFEFSEYPFTEKRHNLHLFVAYMACRISEAREGCNATKQVRKTPSQRLKNNIYGCTDEIHINKLVKNFLFLIFELTRRQSKMQWYEEE